MNGWVEAQRGGGTERWRCEDWREERRGKDCGMEIVEERRVRNKKVNDSFIGMTLY